MTIALPSPKKAVALIEAAFNARGSDIVTKDAYHLLAQVWGYKDWPTASAALKSTKESAKAVAPCCVSHKDVADWPVWVFCNRGGSEDEPLYIYPFGTRLDHLYGNRRHWSLIDDSKAFCMEVPNHLIGPSDARLIVGEEVACEYPDSEEYGIPACASEHSVADFLQEELGFSHVGSDSGRAYVEVTSRCRGDDGMVNWWVQVHVHPSVHARLLSTFTPARCELERAYSELSMQELVGPRGSEAAQLGGTQDSAWAPLTDEFKKWFSSVGHYSLEDLLNSLEGYAITATAVSALPPGFALHEQFAQATVDELHQALAAPLQAVRKSLEAI